MIALGRVMLCAVLLMAVAADRSQPHLEWVRTYSLLLLYAGISILIAAAAWRNWWFDARFAIPMHGVDMAVFTAIVFSSNGSTSPFFLFFVLPLLSAAIRWGWRETAVTASMLVILYLAAGLLIAGTGEFEIERFVIRAGNLLILSLLMIWFGIHQHRTKLFLRIEELEAALTERDNPTARALALVMSLANASSGALIMSDSMDESAEGPRISDGRQATITVDQPLSADAGHSSLLCDLDSDRALSRRLEGHFQFLRASTVIDTAQANAIGFSCGLIAEVRSGTQRGWLLLWAIPDLSCDYIELGRELGHVAGTLLDRYALLAAIEAGAAARTRLSLARDVHDSIVQFLAGAAFRTEAIKRAAPSGSALQAELDELKRLLVEEQGEIRGFIMALRRERELDLTEAVAEIRTLAERLSQQWSVECRVDARDDQAKVPIRLQLDIQQLVREAVANAVRHGQAKQIDIGLAVDRSHLQLSVADNGSGFAEPAAAQPWSLKERVDRASGSLRLESAPGKTRILIDLPLAGAAA